MTWKFYKYVSTELIPQIEDLVKEWEKVHQEDPENVRASSLVFCDFFSRRECPHLWRGEKPKNYSNDLSVNALERQGLGASFELYTGTISRVFSSLRLIKTIAFRIFFSEKSSHTRVFCDFFFQNNCPQMGA